MEIITLTNGKRVANFSSPHSFTFTDGSILSAVDNREADRLKVLFIETTYLRGDISLRFSLTKSIRTAMKYWESLFDSELIDVVFCPLPMITALKEENYNLTNSPFRSVRIADRINKLVSIDKQCI